MFLKDFGSIRLQGTLCGLVLLASLALLGGCGGGGARKPASGGADGEIKQAQSAMQRGEGYMKSKEFSSAVMAFTEAQSAIESGKKKATGNDKSRLLTLEGDVNRALGEARNQQMIIDNQKKKLAESEALKAKMAEISGKTASTKVAAKTTGTAAAGKTTAPAPKAQSAEELKAKEEAEAKKKAEEEAKRKEAEQAALKAEGEKKKTDEIELDPNGGVPKDAAAAKQGEGEAAEGGEGGEAAKAEAAKAAAAGEAVGPYRPVGKNPDPVRVDAIQRKGNYAFAYIQLFNKDENIGKRIGRVEVVFKDAGNGVLFDSMATYDFKDFKADLANPFDNTNGFAVGSHEVPAGKELRIVAVGEHDQRASKAAKAAVTIMFVDGSTADGSGPGSVMDNEKPAEGGGGGGLGGILGK